MSGRRTFVTFWTLALLTLTPFFRVSVTANCPEGFFGSQCKVACHCQGGNQNCDRGHCTQGCDQRFIGPFCQYKAFPPLERSDQIWLQDSNPNTCNNGLKPLVVRPTFRTPVTYMRVTFQQPGLLRKTSFHLSNLKDGVKTTMTCSKHLTRSIDLAGKVYDVPCFTTKVVHSITFDGEGAGKLCELLISPGRNVAPFNSGLGGDIQHERVVDGYIFQDKHSHKACGLLADSRWSLRFDRGNEINMIILYNTGDSSAPGVGQFTLTVYPASSRPVAINYTDLTYSAFFVTALPTKQTNVVDIFFKKAKYSEPFYLCELELLGDLHCCTSPMRDGCLGPKGSSPQCQKKEITACRSGHRGDFCEEKCAVGYYGQNCADKCAVQCKGGACNPTSGNCIKCNAGYSGRRCDKECPLDRYGPGCLKDCSSHCKKGTSRYDSSCDHVTGECLNGCLAGRIGEMCQYDNCSEHCKGGSELCDHQFGTCLLGCEPGYMGLYCYTECPRGAYGEGCREACDPGCTDNHCDKVTGNCVKITCPPGTQLTPECNIQCEHGTYGPGCNERCSSHCSQGECDKQNGTCIHGCHPGYVAPLCIQTCPAPYFGQQCNQRCSPSCKSPCDPVTGNCTLCKPGARGPLCRQACPLGKFGSNCLQSCPGECSRCEVETGNCILCPAGKTGEGCNQDCADGKHGEGCNEFCSQYCFKGSCDPVNGSCTNGCVGKWGPPFCTECMAGWHGSNCEETCSLFCVKCDQVTGKCYSCVNGRTGDSCQDRKFTGVPMENYMIAGIVASALLTLLGMFTFCIEATVEENQKVEKKRGDTGDAVGDTDLAPQPSMKSDGSPEGSDRSGQSKLSLDSNMDLDTDNSLWNEEEEEDSGETIVDYIMKNVPFRTAANTVS